MQQIYRRTPMSKCDFNKVAWQLYWNRTSALVFSYELLHIFRTPFLENASQGLLKKIHSATDFSGIFSLNFQDTCCHKQIWMVASVDFTELRGLQPVTIISFCSGIFAAENRSFLSKCFAKIKHCFVVYFHCLFGTMIISIAGQILWKTPIKCAPGHLKFRCQTRCSNLLMYTDNINFLLVSQFQDQIYLIRITSAGYLLSRASAEDYRTCLQNQAQTLGRTSGSSAESFRCAAGYLKLSYQTECSNQPRQFLTKANKSQDFYKLLTSHFLPMTYNLPINVKTVNIFSPN